MTISEFCNKYHVKENTVRWWVKMKHIPFTTLSHPTGFQYDLPSTARPPVFTRGRKRKPLKESPQWQTTKRLPLR